MAIIKQSNNASINAADLAPFTTVDNGGARPLKDIDAGEFGSLQNGSIVYVESVRDYYKWNPASDAVDDTGTPTSLNRYCNPTINGVNDGRFERLFIYSPDWLLQDFVIDSATGHNENEGTALAPLATDLELRQRWGDQARIEQDRMVTWAQAPAGLTNLNVRLQTGCAFTFQGTPVNKRTGVVLTAVTTQNRATQTQWAITAAAFDATDVGHIVVITDSNVAGRIGAYAYVLEQSGTTLLVSPFGKTNLGAFPPFTEVTPGVDDTVSVITPTVLKPGFISIKGDLDPYSDSPTANICIFDGLEVGDQGTFVGGMIESSNVNTYFVRSIVMTPELAGFNGGFGTNPTFHLCGGGLLFGLNLRAGCVANLWQTGCKDVFGIVGPGGCVVLSTDTYMCNSTFFGFSNSSIISRGASWFNNAFANSTIYAEGGSLFFQGGAVPDWGTNNAGHGITITSTAKYAYETLPTVNSGLGAGREVLVGGTDKLYAAVPYVEGANLAAIVLFV